MAWLLASRHRGARSPSGDILKSGMVVSIEPNVFLAQEGLGARLIDNVIITETGTELLSRTPRGLVIVG